MKRLTSIGFTDWRNQNIPFGIKDNDRFGHIYVIGKTGVGKSTLLLNMAISDIERGNGIAVIDPHGDLAITLLNYIPENRIDDVIYFNPSDTDSTAPFNPLVGIPKEQHNLAVSGLIATFKRIWAENWGPRLEHILRFSLLTLLHYEHATLLDISQLLTNELFRNIVLEHATDSYLVKFWRYEFERYPPQLKAEAIAPILNKMGLFQASAPLRNTVGQKLQTWSVEEVMNTRKIFIANLSKGLIGEDASSLLGSMLVNAFQLAALGRAKQEEHQRVPFFLYLDEAHSFVSLSIADILAEARKFKLSLFLAHQYIEQLHEKIRSAIFGNVGTIISFRIGSEDAEYIAKEFYPVFKEDDLINLPKYSIYLKLMIDGVTSKPFSAGTFPLSKQKMLYADEILESSRRKYGIVNSGFSNNSINTDDVKPTPLF